jgi:hypothetical protein
LLFGSGVLSGVFLLWMGTEGAGVGIYRRVGFAWVRNGGDGASRCDIGGMVLLAVMAAGALQRGSGAVVVRMEAGTRAGGTGEWWGE